MVNLADLEPQKISRDLKGKSVLLYGDVKIGKTTFVAQVPKTLIFAFEPGVNALNNIFSVPVTSWRDFKLYLRQLSTAKVKEKYDFCAFDTVDIMYDLAEAYICSQYDVKTIGDIPFGKGHDILKKEFSSALREIAALQYGLLFISHAQEKVFKNSNSEDYTMIIPAAPTRAKDVINKMVDFIVYIDKEWNQETQEFERFMYLGGDNRVQAGSRFNMPKRIKYGYENFINTLYEVIDKQISEDNATNFAEKTSFYEEDKIVFADVMNEARNIWEKIFAKNDSDKTYQSVLDIITKNFGSPIALSEVTENKKDMLILTVEDLKDFYNKM